MFEHPDMLILRSAGNNGIDSNTNGVIDTGLSLGQEATSKNAMVVGASETYRTEGKYATKMTYSYTKPIWDDYYTQPYDGIHQGMAAFSSRGPCRDGRIKPDIVAPGTGILSMLPANTDLWPKDYSLYYYDEHYQYMQGTSMVTPLVAGSAALVRQWLVERWGIANPDGATIKALLIAGAKSLSPGQYGTGEYREIPSTYPNNVEGWGQANILNTVQPSFGVAINDGEIIAEDETRTFNVHASAGTPLSIVMAYTDAPGNPVVNQNASHLVNDLDLTVTSPDGRTTYYPNSRNSPDRLNNVEGVRIAAGDVATGIYTVTVKAHSIPTGMDPELTGGREDATRFSLVVNGGYVYDDLSQSGIVYFRNTHGKVDGKDELATRAVILGRSLGTGYGNALPVATSDTPDEVFDGWYDPYDCRVTPDTIVTCLEVYYYAHWKRVAVNDERANATRITGANGSAYGTNRYATQDEIDPLAERMGALKATNTVWWVWTAPKSGSARFTTTFSSIDTVLGVSRLSGGGLVWVGGVDDGGDDPGESVFTFYAEAGETYYIEIAGKRGAEGDVRLNWVMFDDVTITFDGNGGAIKESIETGDITGSITTNLYYGLPLGYLPRILAFEAGQYADGGWWTERAGGEQINADTICTGIATYYAHWVPRNDDYANSETFTYTHIEDGSVSIDTRNATLEDGDRMLEVDSTATNTVWYYIEAGSVFRLCVDAAGSVGPDGEPFDPLIAIYRVRNARVADLVASGYGSAVSDGRYSEYIVGVSGHSRSFDAALNRIRPAPYGTINLKWYDTWQLNLDAQGGSFGGSGIQSLTSKADAAVGENALSNEPTLDGYVFAGWSSVPSGGEGTSGTLVTPSLVITNDTTFYATWRARPGNDRPAGATALESGAYGLGGVTTSAFNTDASAWEYDPLVASHGADATLWWKIDRLPYAGVVQFNTVGSTRADGGELDTVMGLYKRFYDDAAGTWGNVELAFNDDILVTDDVEYPQYLRASSNSLEVAKYDTVHVGVGSYRMDGNLGEIVLNWSYEKLLVTLDAAGGSIATNTALLPTGVPVGDALRDAMPQAFRDGYWFLGWMAANHSGFLTEDTVIRGNESFEAVWQPINDDFASARTLNPPGPAIWSYEVMNSNATVEAGEPLAAAWPDVANTLWWTWTAPADGAARFTTAESRDNYGSEIDTVLGVYTGDALGALVEVASGDDYEADDISRFWSRVDFNAVSGTTYRVCVGVADKRNSGVIDGTVRLSWELRHEVTFDADGGALAGGGERTTLAANHGESLAAPAVSRGGYTFTGWFDENGAAYGGSAVRDATYYARWEAGIANDNFANAATLSGPSGTVSQSNDGATMEAGEPLYKCIKNSAPTLPHSLWWKWTAPANGTVQFNTAGSTYYGYDDELFENRYMTYFTVLGIYTGDAVGALTTVALCGSLTDEEGNSIGVSSNSFTVVKGTTYYIGAAGMFDSALNASQQGVIVLNWSGEFEPAATIETLEEGASEADVRTQTARFADTGLDEAIGGSVERWNDFAEWANGVIGDAYAVLASAHAADSWLLGASALLENDPEVTIDGAEVASVSGDTSMTLTVTVKDGENAVEVSAAKVAALFEATTDLNDWTSPKKKLDPHAEAAGGDGTTVRVRVTPGDGSVPKAFLRIKR
ncbi:MAG: S8 family serine peptidase [Kiritimatiellae bacterium]|nr:S8 family serine peptidase [Kiritimatiellia bacterium]